MSGRNYLLDTNARIALLAGNKSIEKMLLNADWVGVSVISVIKFFSFPKLSFNNRLLFITFLERVEVLNLSAENIGFLEELGGFKVDHNLKLPDAVIAAYAIQNQAILISNDTDFDKVNKLSLPGF
jgi:predicted nucleic acid-binding protein